MTKEERELRREQREHMKRMEAAAKEAGRGPIDVPFLLLVLLLTGVGLIMLLSASFPSAYYESGDPLYYFKRQAAFATLGLAAMVVIGRINYARFRGVAKIALGISIALLVAVIIPGVGITSHGATRWLGIPGTTMRFQPSEIAKLGVILYFADSISKKKDKMRTLRYGILPYGFILALIAVLMYFEPHLSGTVLILGIGAGNMNRVTAELLYLEAAKEPFHHVHSVGSLGWQKMHEWVSGYGVDLRDHPSLDVREYIYDMADVMRAADLVICRAGASTLSELTALGVPAILVPSPNVTNHHQEKNAAVLGEHGAALVLPEEGLDGKRLFTEAAALLRDETRLAAMHEASLRLGVRDATERIYETVMALVK